MKRRGALLVIASVASAPLPARLNVLPSTGADAASARQGAPQPTVSSTPSPGHSSPAQPAPADALAALQRGGVAVLLRHAETDPGIGDPPQFRLDDCSTQRNLSAGGREQSRRIGEWFESRRLQPARVRSSAWCRCVDTARLAFGGAEVWPPLASVFRDAQRSAAQTAALRAALAELPPRGFEVWVTHQINISALAGASLPMGHAIVVRGERLADGSGIRIESGPLLGPPWIVP